MNKYTPSDIIINNEIKNTITDVMSNNPGIRIHLSEIALILKYSFRQNALTIKLNGKVRNVISYIKTTHKSLSNYICKHTSYKIIDNEVIADHST